MATPNRGPEQRPPSARHAKDAARAEEHYFAPDPRTPSRPGRARLALPDLALELTTDRGVFAHGAIDPGTKLLLLESPSPPPEGHVLDLGCGYGPIAVVMARRAPAATVWAIDVNDRALRLADANALAAGAGNVVVATPGDVPDDLRFVAIYSNPPVRIGKAALHDLLALWLDRLAPEGVAHLVVHRHLGADSLARWLEARGHAVSRLRSRRGYRLLAVSSR